jgi:hypothetical protein
LIGAAAFSTCRPKNGGAMPDIMIRCPQNAVTVSTGISTNTVQFDSLPDCAIPLDCPACHTVHRWRPRDAWVNGSLRKPMARIDQVSS